MYLQLLLTSVRKIGKNSYFRHIRWNGALATKQTYIKLSEYLVCSISFLPLKSATLRNFDFAHWLWVGRFGFIALSKKNEIEFC